VPIKERSLLSRETHRDDHHYLCDCLLVSKLYTAEVYPIPTYDVMGQLSESVKLLSCP
jgi:hypothetical protein